MVILLKHFGALCLSVAIAALPMSYGGDRLIAQSDGSRVFLRMIVCTPGESKDCRADEQQRLARRIHRVWVRAAIKKYGVTLTSEEQQLVASQTAALESHVQTSAARFHALDDAAVRVRRGEDRATIDADLAKNGITPHDLDVELKYVPTLADAERTAARDQVVETRESARESYAQPFLLDHLRELVAKRAAVEKVSFEVAEERFWSEILNITHTRIVDPAYTMPARKGILVNR